MLKDGEAKVIIVLKEGVEDWKYKHIFEKIGSTKVYLAKNDQLLRQSLSKSEQKQLNDNDVILVNKFGDLLF